jgi:glycosyltransferase involved in cell wall biosynthesis
MSKIKVLIVGAFPPPNIKVFGGVLTSCQALLDSSFPSRFDLVLVDSTQITNPPPNFAFRTLLALHRLIIFFSKLIFEKPQVVILFCSPGASILEKGVMARVSRLFGITVFFFPRGAEIIKTAVNSTFHRVWISYSIKGASHFLCQSQVWQRFATEVLQFSQNNALIVPNWTASNRLLAIGEQRRKPVVTHFPQLLFLGWLEREKGIFELLEACSQLSSFYSFRIVFAGKGNAEQDAKEFVSKKKLTDIVGFAGWVQGGDLEALFSESDIFVLPSWSEGLPNSMIEAMAAKIAVVVSSVGSIPDYVTDGQEALLVPPKNVGALTQALDRLLRDSVFREELAKRGHDFARNNFALETSVDILAKHIEDSIE